MDSTIIINLEELISTEYDFTKNMVNTFKMVGDFEGMRQTAINQTNFCLGAVAFAISLCNKKGNYDLAKEISEKWEIIWSDWFNDFTKDERL